MTDDDKELLKISAEATLKPFADLAQRLFGGTLDQIGGIWEDAVMVRRYMRRLVLMNKVNTAIEAAGFDPRSIPDFIWMPIVEAASRQDDETLQDKWAAMLANAADPRQDSISPAFPGILNELTSREVLFLDALLSMLNAEGGLAYTRHLNPMELQSLYKRVMTSKPEYSKDYLFAINILTRNQLLDLFTKPKPVEIKNRLSRLPKGQIPDSIKVGIETTYYLTELGARFIRTCRAPRPSHADNETAAT